MSVRAASRCAVVTLDDQTAWDQALEQCRPYDVYHTAGYHRVAERSGAGSARLFVFEAGESVIAFPYLVRNVGNLPWIESSAHRDATSVYGYAGPVSNVRDPGSELTAEFGDALTNALARERVVSLFSRLHPLLENRSLVAHLGDIAPCGSTVSIPLTPPRDWLRDMSSNHRRDIRKARQSGVTVGEDPGFETLDGFVQAYHDTMARRRAKDDYFFPADYFRALRKELGSVLQVFIARDADGQILCWVLVFACGPILQYHLSATPGEHVSRSAIKTIFFEVSRWGAERGYQWFHLGGGLGGAVEDGLFRFKRGFSKNTHGFDLLKICLDPKIYDDLCRRRQEWIEEFASDAGEESYFPHYRAPIVAGAT